MASHPKHPDLRVSLMDKLTCSICRQVFKDPVTLTCSHSFCKTCLEDQSGNQCPECQFPVERVPEVNVVLCEIIQQVNGQGGNESQGASGEAQIKELLANWREEITHRENKREELSHDLHSCMENLIGEIQDIKTVFTNMMTVVMETQDKVLQPMLEKKKSLEQEAENLQRNLRTEVHEIHETISELENISNIEDSVDFLLKNSSDQVKLNLADWTDVKLDTNLLFGSMRTTTTQMMENLLLEVEKLTPIGKNPPQED